MVTETVNEPYHHFELEKILKTPTKQNQSPQFPQMLCSALRLFEQQTDTGLGEAIVTNTVF